MKYRALAGRARAGRSYAGDYIFYQFDKAVVSSGSAHAGGSRANVYYPLFQRLKKKLQS